MAVFSPNAQDPSSSTSLFVYTYTARACDPPPPPPPSNTRERCQSVSLQDCEYLVGTFAFDCNDVMKKHASYVANGEFLSFSFLSVRPPSSAGKERIRWPAPTERRVRVALLTAPALFRPDDTFSVSRCRSFPNSSRAFHGTYPSVRHTSNICEQFRW